jgi:hypothetical protein
MTYLDTPAQPLPEVRRLDTSDRAGERHVDRVVAVNGVGLRPEPPPGAIQESEDM